MAVISHATTVLKKAHLKKEYRLEQYPQQHNTLREMFKAYWPLEVFALAFSYTFAFIMYSQTENFASAAVAGTMGEMVGFYGSGFIRQVWRFYRATHSGQYRRLINSIGLAFRAMVIEHGVAGFLDDLLIRPFTLWSMPQVLIWSADTMTTVMIPTGYGGIPLFGVGILIIQLPLFKIGIVTGKIIADLIFYRISLEFRRRFRQHIS